MAGKPIKKGDGPMVLALACGATVEAAARQCGVSDRTVYRRLADTAFLRQVKDARADMARRAGGLLTAAAGQAVQALLELLKPPTPPAARLGAAKAVLELGIKVREVAELEIELRTLEERLNALGPPNPRGPRW